MNSHADMRPFMVANGATRTAIARTGRVAAAVAAIIAMLLCVIPATAVEARAADGYDAPVQSTNAWESEYYMSGIAQATFYNKPMQGFVTPKSDGGFERVEYIVAANDDGSANRYVAVEEYDADYHFVSGMKLDPTLIRPSDMANDDKLLWGGYYEGADAKYIVTGQHNPNQDDSVIVVRVTKFSKDWRYLGSCEISDINTYQIFISGSLRMAELDGKLWIRTAHTMYGGTGEPHHQSNITFVIDESTMTLVDKSATGGSYYNDQYGYVGHSWDQFIQSANGKMYAVDQGDTAPRGILLKQLGVRDNSNLTYQTQGSGIYTGIMLGGFETAANGSRFLISATRISTHTDDALTRGPNIIAVDGADVANATVTVSPMASYPADASGNVKTEGTNTKLVKIDENRFLVIWGERDTQKGLDRSKDIIRYVFVDSTGRKLGDVRSAKARLSDVQPVVVNGKVVWYVTGITDTSYIPPQVIMAGPTVYTIDADTGEFAEHGTAGTHKVSFDAMGGSAVPVQTVEDGAAVSQPAAPTRGTYHFDGWYTSATGGTKYDFSTPVHADLTLYAHWSDVTKPVFSGVDDTTVKFGWSFDPKEGVAATDDVDGDVTAWITVDGDVNIWTTGTYTLTYTVSDKAGNTATVRRTVTVVDDSPVPTPMSADGPSGIAATVDSGIRPDLSGAKATVHWSDGTTTQETVAWDEPSSADYRGRDGGDFTVGGTVSVGGVIFSVNATYRVRPATIGSVSVSPDTLTTAVGVDPTPQLPKTAKVTWSNGDSEDLAVTWNAIDADAYAKAGAFDAQGTVDVHGQAHAVSVRITVTASGERRIVSVRPGTGLEVDPVKDTDPVPALTGTVSITWSDGSMEIRGIPVTPDAGWNHPRTAHTATATGYVDGWDQPVTFPMQVNAATIESVVNGLPTMTTTVGVQPVLPQVTRATWTNGETSDEPILWNADEVPPDVSKPGSVMVNGSVRTDRRFAVWVTVNVKAAENPTCTPVRFTDLAGASHREDIDWLSCQGITKGYDNGDGTVSFGGMRTVVRQDMAAFLYRMAGSPDYTPSAQDRARFTDVNESTSHAKEIWWLAATGITKGYPNGDGTYSFGGMRTVVRQDMAAFLKRYADWAHANPTLGAERSFTDVDSSTSHADEIWWLARTGVTSGYPDGSFGGMRDVVRQDMAAFLHRMDTNVLKQ